MNTQITSFPEKTLSNAALICLVVFIGAASFVGTDVYLPSLPQIMSVFNISIGKTQATVTIFMLGFAISQLIYGPLSDVFGRKPLLMIGFFIYLCGSALTLLAKHIDLLLLARLIQGLGVGSGMSLARVIMRDRFSAQELVRATSYLALGACTTAAAAPALGGFIQQFFGYLGNFVFIGLFAAIMLLLVFIYLPETNAYRHQQTFHLGHIAKNYLTLLTTKIFSLNALSSGLAMGTLVSSLTILPFLLQEQLGLTAAQYGFAVLCISVGLIVGAILNSRFVRHYSPRQVMFIGVTLLFLSGLAELSLTQIANPPIYAIVAFMFLGTVGMPMLFANGMARAFGPFPKIAGTAGALYGSLQIITTSTVSGIVALLHAKSLLALGSLILCLAIINFCLIAQTQRDERR